MIHRIIQEKVERRLFSGKAIVLTGPRQTGKTTLIRKIAEKQGDAVLSLNCDEPDVREKLTNPTRKELENLVGNYRMVLIDEAQRVKNIGVTLKILVDEFKKLQVIASGSSSFELANELNEPLTGRKFEFNLYPLSTLEMVQHTNRLEEERAMETRLIFGSYPDIVTHPGDEMELLTQLSGSYLYKDVFSFQEIRKPELLEKLLEALALQLGNEVSSHELGQLLGVDGETVNRYIDLLEKTFVVFRLTSFSRNLRNELKKSKKIYFYDNGIRNAILRNFTPMSSRTDKGALWENYMVSERKKFIDYSSLHSGTYFWRTTAQQEIDYIESRAGELFAFEFKWNPKKAAKFSKTFTRNYENAKLQLVNPKNYLDFLT